MSSTHTAHPPCRLYVVVARAADTAVVFRRGPSKWWHILRWDLDSLSVESGAWLKGQLYPRRSNVSADGKLLGYFALKGEWGAYFAVSKVPWVTALAAWKTLGTWTTGCVFGPQRELALYGACLDEEPFHGRYPWPVASQGLFRWRRGRYFNEYTRGWSALEADAFAERVAQLQDSGLRFPAHKEPPVIMERRSEDTKRTLGVCDTTDLTSTAGEVEHEAVYYLTNRKNEPERLPGIRWAAWDGRGRLLAATHAGTLEVHAVTRKRHELLWEHDLNGLTPRPVRAPEWAQAW